MTIPSVLQYKEAIHRDLYPKPLEALQALYNCPKSTATATELAQIINPSNPKPMVARNFIGKAGKCFADFCKAKIDDTSKRKIYIPFISPPYQRNVGWTMHKNLQTALEELNLVNKKLNVQV